MFSRNFFQRQPPAQTESQEDVLNMEEDEADGASAPIPSAEEPERDRDPIEASIVASLPSRKKRRPSSIKKTKKSKFREAAFLTKIVQGKDYIRISGHEDEADSVMMNRTYQKPLTARLEELQRKRCEEDRCSTTTTSLSKFKTFKINVSLFFNQLGFYFRENVLSFEIWKKSLKEIEGSYGNSILSYFTFLKWLLVLDFWIFLAMLLFVVIPQAAYQINPQVQNITQSLLNKTAVNVTIEEDFTVQEPHHNPDVISKRQTADVISKRDQVVNSLAPLGRNEAETLELAVRRGTEDLLPDQLVDDVINTIPRDKRSAPLPPIRLSDRLLSNAGLLLPGEDDGIEQSPVMARHRRDVSSEPLQVIDIFEAKTKTCQLVIPHAGSTQNKTPLEFVADFFQGVGWINSTIMFYGTYVDETLVVQAGLNYDMPLAYFLTGCAYMLISLLLIVSSASSIFEEGYIKKGATHSESYINKVLAGWDMCIEETVAANLKRESIIQDIENSLAEDARTLLLEDEFRRHYKRIFCTRFLVNLIVTVLLGLGAWAIFAATNISLQAGSQGSSHNDKLECLHLLESFASSLTVTGLNMILPNLFYFLSKFESWTPRAKVNVDLARTVLIKLSSVIVLMSSLYRRAETICMLCWENIIGAEIYKLMWTNFFVIIVTTLVVECSRRYFADHVDWGCKVGQKVGRPEFQIQKNVLDLVYEQSLIWIGTWYCPLMPLMGIISFVITFYVKKFSLFHNCQRPQERYRAEKNNYFFMLLLLISFIICLGLMTYGVTQIQPSMLYGPFKELPRMYHIIVQVIETYPLVLRTIFKMSISSMVLILAVFLLTLALYFFYATSKAQRSLIRELREELDIEKTDKKYLLRTMVAEKMNEKPSADDGH